MKCAFLNVSFFLFKKKEPSLNLCCNSCTLINRTWWKAPLQTLFKLHRKAFYRLKKSRAIGWVPKILKKDSFCKRERCFRLKPIITAFSRERKWANEMTVTFLTSLSGPRYDLYPLQKSVLRREIEGRVGWVSMAKEPRNLTPPFL